MMYWIELFLIITIVTIIPLTQPQRIYEDLDAYKENFKQFDEPCDEEQAKTRLEVLKKKYTDIEDIPQSELTELSKLICAYRDSGEIICLESKCQCFKGSQLIWDPLVEKCRLKYGEPCEAGNQCHSSLICSDEEGPPRLRRDDPYLWKVNEHCIDQCITRTCNREQVDCLGDGLCSTVTDCLADPFTRLPCIDECNDCSNIDITSEFQSCTARCLVQYNGYINTTVNRICNQDCRKNENAQQCYRECIAQGDIYLASQREETCPSRKVQEKCNTCIEKALRNAHEDGVFTKIQKICAKDCKDTSKCYDQCFKHCLQYYDYEFELVCADFCGDYEETDPLCRTRCYISKLDIFAEEANKLCLGQCNVTNVCQACSKTCRSQIEKGFHVAKNLEFHKSLEGCQQLGDCKESFALYPCDSCELAIEREGQICRDSCQAGTEKDQCSNCVEICRNVTRQIHEARCFFKERLATNGTRISSTQTCLARPLSYTCEEECSTNDCPLACEDYCERGVYEITRIYCNPRTQPFICNTRPPCTSCQNAQAAICKQECRQLAGPNPTPEKCLTTCEDICDKTIAYFRKSAQDARSTNQGYFTSCAALCDNSMSSICISPCLEYCEETQKYRCDCDNNTIGPVPINLSAIEVKPSVCVNCRRAIIKEKLRVCKGHCGARVGADPLKILCFEDCLKECSKTMVRDMCLRLNVSPTKQKACVNSNQHSITTSCFIKCYNKNPEHLSTTICQEGSCLLSCIESAEKESLETCIEDSGRCKQVQIPAYKQKVVIEWDCSDACRNVRLDSLKLCRETCILPSTLYTHERLLTDEEVKDRDETCFASCKQICLEQQLLEKTVSCIPNCGIGTSGPCDVSTDQVHLCVSSQLKTMIDYCNMNCPDHSLQGDPLAIECPVCSSYCFKEYFQSAALLKCRNCVTQKIEDDQCKLCKRVLQEDHCVNECNVGDICNTCVKYCSRFPCVTKYASPFRKRNTTLLDECARDMRTSCITTCAPTCNATCKDFCVKVRNAQGVCNINCVKAKTNPTITFRSALEIRHSKSGKSPKGRPTRKPGPHNSEQYWCCHDKGDGKGQCNAPNPRRSEIKGNSAMRIIFGSQCQPSAHFLLAYSIIRSLLSSI